MLSYMGNIVQTRRCLCQKESSGSLQFYRSHQTWIRERIWRSSAVQSLTHLTQCPKVYYENFSISWPSRLEPHATFYNSQLQFFQEFLFAPLGHPSPQALAAHSLLQTTYWAGCFQAAHILGFIDGQSQGIHDSIGKLIIGHKLHRQQITLKESPGNALAMVQTFSPLPQTCIRDWVNQGHLVMQWENRGHSKPHQV